MEIAKSQRGRDKLIYKGFIYTRESRRGYCAAWKCVVKGCKGQVKTPLDYQQYVGQDNIVRVVVPHTNHGPDPIRVREVLAYTRAVLYKMETKAAETTTTTATIENGIVSSNSGEQQQQNDLAVRSILEAGGEESQHELHELHPQQQQQQQLPVARKSSAIAPVQDGNLTAAPGGGYTPVKKYRKSRPTTMELYAKRFPGVLDHIDYEMPEETGEEMVVYTTTANIEPSQWEPSLFRIGFIGAGNIAKALVGGFINSGYIRAEQISMAAPTEINLADFKELGCTVTTDNGKVFDTFQDDPQKEHLCFFLFICVKPDVPNKHRGFWSFVKNLPLNFNRLILVSVMAGVTINTLKQMIRPDDRPAERMCLARIMPNTACAINAGAVGVSFEQPIPYGPMCPHLKRLLDALGLCQEVPEDQLHAVCGLAGSGIAFVYTMLQAMADGGVLCGLPRPVAMNIAAQTVAGAAAMVKQTNSNPMVLRDQVCSPGGTTINGVYALEKGRFNCTVMDAIQSATNRSMEYSRFLPK